MLLRDLFSLENETLETLCLQFFKEKEGSFLFDKEQLSHFFESDILDELPQKLEIPSEKRKAFFSTLKLFSENTTKKNLSLIQKLDHTQLLYNNRSTTFSQACFDHLRPSGMDNQTIRLFTQHLLIYYVRANEEGFTLDHEKMEREGIKMIFLDYLPETLFIQDT